MMLSGIASCANDAGVVLLFANQIRGLNLDLVSVFMDMLTNSTA